MRIGSLLVLLHLLGMTLVGCAGPPRVTDLPLDETSAARKLYVAKCAKCHKFYNPAKYSDEEWHKWMVKMNKKSKLTPEQAEMLSKYIDNTFRDGHKTGP